MSFAQHHSPVTRDGERMVAPMRHPLATFVPYTDDCSTKSRRCQNFFGQSLNYPPTECCSSSFIHNLSSVARVIAKDSSIEVRA